MEWKEITLKDIAFYRNDKVKFSEVSLDCYISTENMIENKGGVVPPSSIPSSGSSNIYLESDILISNIRPYFKKIWFADKDGACSNDVLVFAIKNESIDTSFLYYKLSTDDFFDYVMAGSNGVKMPRGNKKSIMDYKFLLPPLKTQQKIASILSNYDKLIENNTQRIKLLESMAEELYKEWFVRLRFPGYEDVEVVDGLPVGWERKLIQDVSILTGGGTPSTAKEEYWENGDINWFSPTDLSQANSMCLFESVKKTNDIGIKNSSAKILQSDSFMMTSRATIGLFGLIKKSFSTNQGFINITPLRKKEKYYLFYNLKIRVNELKSIATGATFPELSKSQFKVLKIVMPSEKVINLFHHQIEPIIEQLFILEDTNKNLKQTRDLLLPHLMSGKLNVEDLDII